eukprot:1160394-Pelagomonas_calceolata.AAC.4
MQLMHNPPAPINLYNDKSHAANAGNKTAGATQLLRVMKTLQTQPIPESALKAILSVTLLGLPARELRAPL